jgi:hypothetical protein
MANRAVFGDVEAILDTELTDSEITAYITTSNLLVTDRLGSSGLAAALLTQIETYLAAHLITTTRERKAAQTSGEGGVKFEGQTGMRLDSTFYGQTAMVLDTTGKLSTLNKPTRTAVVFEVL